MAAVSAASRWWKACPTAVGRRPRSWARCVPPGFVAPLCVEGAINGELFEAWIEQHLVQVLRLGDIVVMDNLSSH